VFFFLISLITFLIPFLETEEHIINLETPSYLNSKKGSIRIGRVLKGNKKKYSFSLTINDLEKHMFICGATGTGKSNFLQNFLINFTKHHKIPFFLVEFKGEYHFLQNKIDDVVILWPGINFSINIFNPEKTSPIIHAERIFDILKSGQFLDDNSDYSPQMEKVLVDVLTNVCENKNSQNWAGFERKCEEYLNHNQKNIPMLKQTLISIKNRIRRFSKGPLKVLFDIDNELEVNELFNRNIILDLSSIIRLGGEKEDALFFLNMIFKYLWDKNLTNGARNFNGIKHITIVEDAQYFAPRDLRKKNKLTTYLEDIALLQRGTGECLITLATRPDISREILANCGVLLTFKNHLEKDIMCELLNLDGEYKNYLSILQQSQCIIRINKRNSIKFSEICKRNQEILNNKIFGTNSKKELKKRNNFPNINHFNQNSLNKKYILKKCAELEKLYKENSFNELKIECIKTIDNILEKISLQIGFNYKGIDHFLKNLINFNLEKKFIFYNELIQLSEFLNNLKERRNQLIFDKGESIFIITKNILNKLKMKQNKRKNENFLSGYEEFKLNSLRVKNKTQGVELLRKKSEENNHITNADTENKEIMKLKSYINDLINLQKKSNKF
jgi:hypothetical protein